MTGNVVQPTGWPREATPCDLQPRWAGEFRDFDDWVNFATARLTGARGSLGQEVAPICVDALGRRCSIGGEFMRARDEGAFPVRYFWECKPGHGVEASVRAYRRDSADEDGFWRTCSGCHETEDGHDVGRYPLSEAFGCQLGGGCGDCGGIGAIWDTTNYEAMARHMLANEKLDDEALDPHLPENLQGERRCGIQRSAWLPGWYVPWSPRNDNENAEGPWSHWVNLAREIIAADEQAREKARAHG